jgi:hypothetical protein
MVSSVEEFILLLKKWSGESARVWLIASFADPQVSTCRGVLRLSGKVTALDEQTRVFRIEGEQQLALIGFAGCRLGYGAGADIELASQISDAGKLEDVVCLVTPSGLSVCMYTLDERL